ncbi:MAG: dockerin type I domain-containing protein, partial [Planctomycetota bacterium]
LYDLNADGTVGNADSIILITNWLKSSLSDNEYLLGDINDDALIDANDLKILINHIGQSATWKNI